MLQTHTPDDGDDRRSTKKRKKQPRTEQQVPTCIAFCPPLRLCLSLWLRRASDSNLVRGRSDGPRLRGKTETEICPSPRRWIMSYSCWMCFWFFFCFDFVVVIVVWYDQKKANASDGKQRAKNREETKQKNRRKILKRRPDCSFEELGLGNALDF